MKRLRMHANQNESTVFCLRMILEMQRFLSIFSVFLTYVFLRAERKAPCRAAARTFPPTSTNNLHHTVNNSRCGSAIIFRKHGYL